MSSQYQNILLIVTGASPQVLTETLYGIHQSGKPFPDRVIAITTENTRAILENGLFRDGQLQQMLNQHQMPQLLIGSEDILIIKDSEGRALDKGKSEADQLAIADFITQTVANIARDENTAIHASIAGGRKTMGFYLGYAMSLFGRSQDKLSHIFINDEFEFVRDCWFPTLQDKWVTGKNGQGEVNCKEAQVTLCEIPFVRMRNSLDPKLVESITNTGFCQQVSMMNQAFDQNFSIALNKKTKAIEVLGVEVKLTPKEFAFYWWLYMQGEKGFLRSHAAYDDPKNAGSYLSYFIQLSQDQRVLDTFKANELDIKAGDFSSIIGMPNDWFEQNISKINNKIDKVLPADTAARIKIDSLWDKQTQTQTQTQRTRRSMVNTYATEIEVVIS